MNLEQRFGSVFVAHIFQLRSCLHSVSKCDLAISEYLQRIKSISDTFMVARTPASDHDLIVVTLNGLPSECESFIELLCFTFLLPR